MPQTIALTRQQAAALASLPPGATARDRAAALGWAGRALTPAEREHVDPTIHGTSRTEQLHATHPPLVTLWATVEAAQAEADKAHTAWAAAVTAARRDELQSGSTGRKPWRPAEVNVTLTPDGGQTSAQRSALATREHACMNKRDATAQRLADARQRYNQALMAAAREVGWA